MKKWSQIDYLVGLYCDGIWIGLCGFDQLLEPVPVLITCVASFGTVSGSDGIATGGMARYWHCLEQYKSTLVVGVSTVLLWGWILHLCRQQNHGVSCALYGYRPTF